MKFIGKRQKRKNVFYRCVYEHTIPAGYLPAGLPRSFLYPCNHSCKLTANTEYTHMILANKVVVKRINPLKLDYSFSIHDHVNSIPEQVSA